MRDVRNANRTLEYEKRETTSGVTAGWLDYPLKVDRREVCASVSQPVLFYFLLFSSSVGPFCFSLNWGGGIEPRKWGAKCGLLLWQIRQTDRVNSYGVPSSYIVLFFFSLSLFRSVVVVVVYTYKCVCSFFDKAFKMPPLGSTVDWRFSGWERENGPQLPTTAGRFWWLVPWLDTSLSSHTHILFGYVLPSNLSTFLFIRMPFSFLGGERDLWGVPDEWHWRGLLPTWRVEASYRSLFILIPYYVPFFIS